MPDLNDSNKEGLLPLSSVRRAAEGGYLES